MLNKLSNQEYLIFHIEGGLGKNVLATAVIEATKKHYVDKKIVIVTAWEEVWYHNPNIYRVYKFGTMNYFYDDYVFDNTKIFRIDPYHSEDFILKKNHLIETWCKMYNIPYNGEQPRIYLTPREIESAKDKLKLDKRPILLLQTNGGTQHQPSNKSWARDLPIKTAQEIVNAYHQGGWRILHNRREDQPALQNTEYFNIGFRETFAACLFSQKRLFIDSFLQHVCAALNLPSVVCWSTTDPKVFGYNIHNNVMPKASHVSKHSKYAYLEQFEIIGNIHENPYNTTEIFNAQEIVNSLEAVK